MKKIRKYTLAFNLAVLISVLSVFSSFAVNVTENPSYTWEYTNGKWTCTDEDGDAVKGWAMRDSKVYYLNSRGRMRTGWVKNRGDWYYLYKSEDVNQELVGTLATDSWIDNYYVDEEGVWTRTK